MKKLLDQHNDNIPWEVNSDIRLDVTKSCLHRKKDQKPFKKILTTQNPKLGQARPLYYNRLGDRKFPLPKPRLTNGIIP